MILNSVNIYILNQLLRSLGHAYPYEQCSKELFRKTSRLVTFVQLDNCYPALEHIKTYPVGRDVWVIVGWFWEDQTWIFPVLVRGEESVAVLFSLMQCTPRGSDNHVVFIALYSLYSMCSQNTETHKGRSNEFVLIH